MDPPAQNDATYVARAEHCYYCCEVLAADLAHRPVPAHLPFPDVHAKLLRDGAPSGTPRLRGCIGTFAPQDLAPGLAYFARQAAFHDHRFAPITADEAPRLECSVSLLSPFEPCADYLDWTLGVHGVYVRFRDPANGRDELTATFLPEVASAQGWSQQETIETAMRKAGWHGPITAATLRAVHVYRYTSTKTSVTWADYVAWKSA
ncbi:hypothetical protein MBRA1_003739 [Malassezia brasiliensis]|uniref:AMMECR1 domain-containing protein n=1 Tax=Malassezia brasiliensis TaxID=1821822 RepID=A0AAF0E019_9BASI|nr:hypothetical protein MBRA1_003739 [Malassezia brasiliensis]